MKKIKVYKDSKGRLYESENEYLKNEYDNLSEEFIKITKRWKKLVKSDPENFYKIIFSIVNRSVDVLPSEIKEQYIKKLKFIEKAKKAKYEIKDGPPSTPVDNFGEDISNYNASPGSWRGISAQDLI